METVQGIGMKIFRMNTGLGGVNRRQLFNVIKRLPEMRDTYAWMVAHKLLHEYPKSEAVPGQKTELVVELTEVGSQFLDRLNYKKTDKSAALPPVAYAVDRELYAKLAVVAELRDKKPEDELAKLLAEYTQGVPEIVFDAAKKNRADLFF